MEMPVETTSSTNTIKDAASSTIGANAVIQTYINTVLATPDINLSSVTFSDTDKHVITDLPLHQQLARKNAEAYTDGPNSVNSQMINTLSDIIGFSNMFDSRYLRLLALAGPQGNPQGQDLITFNQGLQGLINTITLKQNNCGTIITSLGNFKNLILQDERNLQGDENIITATLGGEQGAIKLLKDNITACHSAIEKDNAMIAGGAGMEVGGILMIVVGVATEELSFGASTALVVGGLACVGGGIAMQVLAGKDISAKMDQLKTDNTNLTEDETVVACLTLASKNVTAMINSIDSAVAALTSLQSGWSSLSGDFSQIIQALQSGEGDTGDWLITDLNAAKSDWDDANTLAIKLQSNGTLQVSNSNPITYPKVG